MTVTSRTCSLSGLFAAVASGILLIGFAVVVLGFLYGPPYRLEQYDLPKEIAIGSVGLFAALLLIPRACAVEADRIALLLFAFVCWGAVVSAALAVNGPAAWRTVGHFGAATLVFLLARRLGRLGAGAAIYWGVAIVVSVMCVVVLLEAYGGLQFLSAPGRRPGATLGNRNLAARLACCALPVVLDRLIARNRTKFLWMLWAMTAALSATIVLSRSRGALLVSLLVIMVLSTAALWLAPKDVSLRWRSATRTWLLGVSIGAAAAILLPNRMGWNASDFANSGRRVFEFESGTGRGRLIQAETTWRMIRREWLLGVAPGNWSVRYPDYARNDDPSVSLGAFYPGPQTPRNDILALIAEWGVVGFGMGIALLATLGSGTRKLLRSSSTRARQAGLMVLGVSASAAMLGLFDSVLRVAPSAMLIALLVGVALGDGEGRYDCAKRRKDCAARRIWMPAIVVCAVFSLVMTRSASQDLAAMRIINSFDSTQDLARAVAIAPNNVEARGLLSYVLVTAGRCDLASPHLRRAAQLQPRSAFVARLESLCTRSMPSR